MRPARMAASRTENVGHRSRRGAAFKKPRHVGFHAGMVMFQLANAPMLPLVATELTKTSATRAVPLIGACIVLPQIIVALFAPWVGHARAKNWPPSAFVAALAVLPIRGVLLAFFNGAFPVVSIQILDGVSAAVLGVLIPLVVADISYGTGHFNLAQGVIGMSIGARRGDQHDRRGLHRRHVRAPCRVSDAGSNGGVRRFAASVIHARDPAHG